MSVSFRSFTFARLAGAVAALWLGCTGPVWAGDGGGDLGSLNSMLQGLCTTLTTNFGVSLPSCPQAPSVTQGVLQLAAWNLSPTEMLRATNNIPPGAAVDAGSPSLPPAVIPTTPVTTAITAFPVTSTALSNLLPNLRPLAFVSSPTSPAKAAQLFNPNADNFLYAVASGFLDNGGQPDTLFFFYEDTSRTNPNLKQGQIVAKMSLPLIILSNSATESLVTATLQFRATKAGDCSASTVTSTLWPNGITPDLIGVDCAVVFAPSPVSAKSHAIFEVAVPLIVTMATDPLYFFNPIVNVGSPFMGDVTGHSAGILGPNGNSIGMGTSAVPLCSATVGCPPLSPPPPSPVFALCANLPAGNGNAQAPVPSVAAYYAISTAGETLLSAALPATTTSVCPF
jgi:hypothetical protein